MGGKLFGQPRMPRDRYVGIEREVREVLDREMPGAYRIPRFYVSKPDFGDMDVLVAEAPEWEQERLRIAGLLGAERVQVVGQTTSMLVRGLQVDFTPVPAAELDCSAGYLDFNDLSNIVGRILRRFDLKWGQRGLLYVYRYAQGNELEELLVTRDFARVCAFLGLDHAVWLRGFDTLDEMFRWVVASPHFSVAPYIDGEPKAQTIKGARRTIEAFITWLAESGVTQRPDFLDRRAYTRTVADAFPEAGLLFQLDAARARETRKATIAARFNGKLVMALRPELTGQALGEFIRAFKHSMPDFDSWALGATADDVAARVRAFVVPQR